nr:MAG TPA: hypothetical protein [Bacteriophage sp.]
MYDQLLNHYWQKNDNTFQNHSIRQAQFEKPICQNHQSRPLIGREPNLFYLVDCLLQHLSFLARNDA